MTSLNTISPWFLISVPLPPAASRPKNSRTITVHPSFLYPSRRQRNPASSPVQRARVRLHATSARNAYIDLPSASYPPPHHHRTSTTQEIYKDYSSRNYTTTLKHLSNSITLQLYNLIISLQQHPRTLPECASLPPPTLTTTT